MMKRGIFIVVSLLPALALGQPAVGLSPANAQVLAEKEEDFRRYFKAADEHYARLEAISRRELLEKQAEIAARYAADKKHLGQKKSKFDGELIARLEKFIATYPDHPKHTPDAMYRLADLYLDKAEDDLIQAEESGSDEELVADYSRSLQLWERVIREFPNYRQIPSSLYLLAYYSRVDDERRALQLFLALTCANEHQPFQPPPPELTREQVRRRIELQTIVPAYQNCTPYPGADPALVENAWLRGVADHHFNMPGELDEALGAYSYVTRNEKSELYMEALYKEAWSYYRRDYLLEAIKGFDRSVVLYDQTVAENRTPALELREEALQYIAVGLTDPWQGEIETDPDKALQRTKDFYAGREKEPHVRDVWETVGRAFADLQAYDQAVIAFKVAIGPPWELDPKNPEVHQLIVDAYELKGDKYAADKEASLLASSYAPGTAWYTANEKNRDAMEAQRRIAERALFSAAQNMHRNATEARGVYDESDPKDPADKQAYLELYDEAIAMYLRFIETYPDSEYVYEFMYSIGEASFFSEKYLQAADYYRWVRDHKQLSEKYYLNAAKGVVDSYEAAVAAEVAAGRLPALVVPDGAALAALPKPITPRTIPELYVKQQAAWDEYLEKVNEPKTAPEMGINAALVSLAYLHLPDSEARLKKVLTKWCGKSLVTSKAKDNLLMIYDAQGQIEKFEQTNNDFIANKCGDAKSIELAQSQNRSLEFRRAGLKYEEAKQSGDRAAYERAANGYYRYYKTAPDDDGDLPTALFNAAFSLEKAGKPKSAIGLYREFTQDPKLRSHPYYLEALRQTGVAYQGAFDYENATRAYKTLYEEAKAAKSKGITPPPNPDGGTQDLDKIRLDALYNTAAMYELNRDFKRAITYYKKYEAEEPNRAEKSKALLSIARIHISSGNYTGVRDTYASWRKKYGSLDATQYVRSYYDTANVYAKRGRTRDADKYRTETIKAWKSKGAVTGGDAARMAGEFQLYFAEKYYKKNWVSFVIKKKARNQSEAKKYKGQFDSKSKATQDEYLKLDQYGIPEYSMAAKVRFGETLASYGPKFLEMPTPRHVEQLADKYPDQDIYGQYEAGLTQIFEPKVQQAKTQWTEVVNLSKQAGIHNKWTQLALENLSREFPAEFTALNQELIGKSNEP